MSTTGGPGQGLTLSLSGDTTISRVRTVQLPEVATQEVDFTGLDELEWFQFLAATLKDGGALVAEMFMNTEIARPTVRLVQVATVTFAKQTTGSASGAQLTGSGFITSLGYPAVAIGEPLLERIVFKFDNIGTKLAYTPEA